MYLFEYIDFWKSIFFFYLPLLFFAISIFLTGKQAVRLIRCLNFRLQVSGQSFDNGLIQHLCAHQFWIQYSDSLTWFSIEPIILFTTISFSLRFISIIWFIIIIIFFNFFYCKIIINICTVCFQLKNIRKGWIFVFLGLFFLPWVWRPWGTRPFSAQSSSTFKLMQFDVLVVLFLFNDTTWCHTPFSLKGTGVHHLILKTDSGGTSSCSPRSDTEMNVSDVSKKFGWLKNNNRQIVMLGKVQNSIFKHTAQ